MEFSNVTHLFHTTMETTTSEIATSQATSKSYMIRSFLLYTIGSLSLVGNLLVVVVIFQYTKMRRNLTNVYVINQSLIDGAAGLFLILTEALNFHFDRRLSGIWGEILCRVWAAQIPLWGLLHSSTFNLVALTLERYSSVIYPIKHKVSFTRPKVILSLVCVWLIGPFIQLGYKVIQVNTHTIILSIFIFVAL